MMIVKKCLNLAFWGFLLLSGVADAQPEITLQQEALDAHTTAYWVVVPAELDVVLAMPNQLQPKQLQTVAQQARQYKAMVALNGSFFDPVNQKTTAQVVQHGQLTGNPEYNERLTGNVRLKPYLSAILNQRSQWQQWQCATGDSFWRIESPQAHDPVNCTLVQALGAGPVLPVRVAVAEMPVALEAQAEKEGFWAREPKTGRVVRDAIGLHAKNARSVVFQNAQGQWVLAMIAQKTSQGGVSLLGLTQWCRQHGAVSAMALDGGSSSALWALGNLYSGKRDAKSGQPVQRAVLTTIIVRQPN